MYIYLIVSTVIFPEELDITGGKGKIQASESSGAGTEKN